MRKIYYATYAIAAAIMTAVAFIIPARDRKMVYAFAALFYVLGPAAIKKVKTIQTEDEFHARKHAWRDGILGGLAGILISDEVSPSGYVRLPISLGTSALIMYLAGSRYSKPYRIGGQGGPSFNGTPEPVQNFEAQFAKDRIIIR